MSRYFESAPARSFQPYVVCNWKHIFEGDSAHDFKVLPDGCVDIILIGDRPPLVVGPNLKAFVASFDGPTKIVGIRLKPGIAAAVLNENVKNIVNREVPLEDLWGSRALKKHRNYRTNARLFGLGLTVRISPVLRSSNARPSC